MSRYSIRSWTVAHDSNRLRGTTYAIAAVNSETGRVVVIGVTAKGTQRSLWDACADKAEGIRDLLVGRVELCRAVGKGRECYIKIDNTPWSIKRYETLKSLNGRTLERMYRDAANPPA